MNAVEVVRRRTRTGRLLWQVLRLRVQLSGLRQFLLVLDLVPTAAVEVCEPLMERSVVGILGGERLHGANRFIHAAAFAVESGEGTGRLGVCGMKGKLVVFQLAKLGRIRRTNVGTLQGLVNGGIFRRSGERRFEQAGGVGEESEIGVLKAKLPAQPERRGESRFQLAIGSNGDRM